MKSARELALEIIAKRGTPDFAICALNNAEAVARALLGKQHLTSEPAASAPVPSPTLDEIRAILDKHICFIGEPEKPWLGHIRGRYEAAVEIAALLARSVPVPSPTREQIAKAMFESDRGTSWAGRGALCSWEDQSQITRKQYLHYASIAVALLARSQDEGRR